MEETELHEMRRRLDALEAQLGELVRLARETRMLVGPFGVALPGDTLLIQTIWGIKLVVDALDQVMTPNLVVYRQWEAELSSLMAGYATPDTVFVDVGANVGYFTCLVASRIGSSGSGRAIAVEPNPHCVSLLRRNLVINWSLCPVQVEAVAVSDRAGSASLSILENQLANAHLGRPVGNEQTLTVEMQRLDELLSNVSKVDLLKIDIEGYEPYALRGARETIHRNPHMKIILEWSIDQMQAAGTTVEEMHALMTEMKLMACRLPASLHECKPSELAYSLAELKATRYANILLVRSDTGEGCDDVAGSPGTES